MGEAADRQAMRPFVFPAPSVWRGSPDLIATLRDTYGQLQLVGLQGSYGWVLKYTEHAKARALGIDTLGDYLALFGSPTATPLPYLTHLSINRILPRLRPMLAAPAQLRPNWAQAAALDRLGGAELFFGPRGSGFDDIHVDHAAVHVGFCQLRGAKQFILFPPWEGRYLYRYRGAQFPYQLRNSRVTVAEHRNLRRFPLLRHTHPLTLDVRAGEALFLPANWWHGTINLEDSVSYSVRIVNASNVLQTLGAYALGPARAVLRALGR
jgi:hypothetical protein